jgi:hypothetical protein
MVACSVRRSAATSCLTKPSSVFVIHCRSLVAGYSASDTASRPAEGFVDAMRDALRAYLRFAGVSRLEWAPHLGTEKRLFQRRR